MLIKQNLSLFNSVLNEVNLQYLLYLMAWRGCFLHLRKQNCFLKTFFLTSYLDDSGIFLPVYPSRTNLKLLNISATLQLVKKVINNLDFSKASNPDCFLVVVLQNCEPERSYILAEIFNLCWKESCFPNSWKVSLVFPVFKILGNVYH